MAVADTAGQGSVPVDPFVRTATLLMALTLLAGFTAQFLAGRSSFAARPLVHIHGLAFFAWVGLFAAQVWLVRAGNRVRHRQLGLVGAAWMPVLIVLGTALTVDVVQRGTTPPFFSAQHFLVANPLSVLCCAGLTAAAIACRRAPDWHRRLHVGALALLMGPGLGRLLPMPLLGPYAFEIAALAGLGFIVAGMVWDVRTRGRVHPAWSWSLAVGLLWLVAAQAIAHGPLGDGLYAWVTRGTPGASNPG